MSNLTYAVADLHGRLDLLDAAIEAIEAHADERPLGNRAIVFLGDYVDRGPDSRGVIERLIAGPAPRSRTWDWVCLKGNHDDTMARAGRLLDGVEHNRMPPIAGRAAA